MASVSVIIPTYNRAHLVASAVQSVIDQTFADWELLVVDDGSTDETAEVVGKFGTRVMYLRQDNRGVCAARNAGLAAARGEFVAFLDSDDQMLPRNLEINFAILDARPDVAVAYGQYYPMSEQGQCWPTLTGPTFEGEILAQLLLEEIMMGTSLIRRASVGAIGGFDETIAYGEHWDFYLRLARSGCLFASAGEPVVLIRQHAQRRGADKDAMLKSGIKILDRYFGDASLTDALAGVRREAYYRSYLDFALDNYEIGHFAQGTACLGTALQYMPLDPQDAAKLAARLVYSCMQSGSDEALELARRVLKPLDQAAAVRRLRAKVLAQLNAALARRAARSRRPWRVWRHTLGAVFHDPSYLGDRGLARTALEGTFRVGMADQAASNEQGGASHA